MTFKLQAQNLVDWRSYEKCCRSIGKYREMYWFAFIFNNFKALFILLSDSIKRKLLKLSDKLSAFARKRKTFSEMLALTYMRPPVNAILVF